MKNIGKILGAGLLFAALFTACADERNSMMVDDTVSFKPTAAVLNGVIALPTYDEYYEFPIYKNGKGLTSAVVTLEASEEALAAYNEEHETSYVALPESCYTIHQTTFTFAASDVYKMASLEWSVSALSHIDQTKDYVIPLQLVSEGAAPHAERSLMLVSVDLSAVSFIASPDVRITKQGVIGQGQVVINTPLEELDIDIAYEVDNAYVAVYNEEHGTNYKGFNTSKIQLSKPALQIPANGMSDNFEVLITTEALVETADDPEATPYYVVPVHITSISDGAKLLNDVVYYVVEPMSKSQVTLTANAAGVIANGKITYSGTATLDAATELQDVTVTFSIDNSLVAAYNSANNTNYSAFSSGVALTKASTTIPAMSTSATFGCEVPLQTVMDNIDKFKSGSGYVVPIRATVSDGAELVNNVVYVVVVPAEVKGPWSVLEGAELCYSRDPNNGGAAWIQVYKVDRLFDGDWANEHISLWETDNVFPQTFVVDMGQNHIFTKFIISDSYNYQGNARDYQIYVSETYPSANWQLVASGMRAWNWVGTQDKANPDLRYDYPIQNVAAGRYLKFVVVKVEFPSASGDYIHGRWKLGDVQGMGF